jgi:hypothetical protein
MFRPNRFCYLPLALLLVAGIFVLAEHSALHDKSEAERCLMCSSHADMDNVTVATSQSVPVQIDAQSMVEPYSGHSLPIGSKLTTHARAPPSSV